MHSALVWLSLGSNVGSRSLFLKQALTKIAAHPRLDILRQSSILENPAMLHTDQADFLNQIIECRCDLEATDLLDILQHIEQKIGRIKRFPNGPREIDLDILTYNQQVIQNERLTIPHLGLQDRPYLFQLFSEFGLDCQKLALPR